jgi:probable phosphoglycerate mutase
VSGGADVPGEHLSLIVEADGGARGNPGPAGYGAVVRNAVSGRVVAERSEYLGHATNNVAEYRGLIAGLGAALEIAGDDAAAAEVDVRMDSKLVVEQMSGRWQVKHAEMRQLAAQANELRRRFASVRFAWIPRAENSHADRLANEAMDAGLGIERTPRRARPSGVASWVPPTQPPTRLFLVRHGSTEHSAAMRFSGRNELPLDAAGEAQAAALALRLKDVRNAGSVVTSPLLRARQTAEAIAAGAGLGLEVNDDLVETDFGEWEGLTYAEVAERYPDELRAWQRSPDAAPPGGEPFSAVGIRAQRALEAIVAAHPAETVVVVTHVTPIKSLLRQVLEAPPIALFRIHLDTASVSQLDCYPDGNYSVRLVNDTSHLRS